MDARIKSAHAELENAYTHQKNGLVGRSRVCARRAAGAALQAYFSKMPGFQRNQSAMDLLKLLQNQADIPLSIHHAADVLTMRVNEEFTLPTGDDPLLAAKTILDWVESTITGDN